MVSPAEVVELVLLETETAPETPEALVDEVEGESIVACSHRRMDREVGVGDNGFPCLLEGEARLDQFPATFQHHEGAVSFVHVPVGGVEVQCPEHAHAADPKDHLLRDTRALVTAVEPLQDLAVLRTI